MERCQFQEIYPVFSKEFLKKEVVISSLEKFCQYFYDKIEKHPFAKYIETFDHYAHTTAIEGGIIAGITKNTQSPEGGIIEKKIISAKIVLFCFGKKLLDPKILSVRPRAIGLCETETHYIISFLEVPNPLLTETMIKWVRDIEVQ